MGNELAVINSHLSAETRQELDTVVDRIIERSKHNRNAINRMVFESTAVLTDSDRAQSELKNKGFFKRLIGGISGSNQRLQNEINNNHAAALYASQQMLNKLAEQNQLSFELIAAINNKLNNSLSQVAGEIENIYSGFRKFINASRSELVKLDSRLANVERNVEILNWQNSIEYLAFNGVEYRELDDAAKLLCLAKDFYEKTQGKWNTQDLLLLKSAMASIDMDSNKNINYFNVLKEIATTPELKAKLFDNESVKLVNDPSYLITMSTISKINSLQNEESYVVEAISDYMGQKGVDFDSDETISNLTKKYLAENALVNVDTDMKAYDFLVDLLFNLRSIEDGDYGQLVSSQSNGIKSQSGQDEELPPELEEACKLFWNCKLKEALPIFRKYANEGNTNAMYFLTQYPRIDDTLVSKKEGGFWIRLGTIKNGVLCKSVSLFNTRSSYNQSKNEKCYKQIVMEIQKVAYELKKINTGTVLDEFCLYEYMRCKLDYDLDELMKNTRYWMEWRKLGAYFEDESNKDINKALECYKNAIKYGCNYALYDIASLYDNELEDYESAISYYKRYYELNLPLAGKAANRIGVIFEDQDDEYNAIKWYEKAVEKGFAYAYSNLASFVEDDDPRRAIQLYKKSCELLKDIDNETVGSNACSLGNLFINAEKWSEAFFWLKKSAELNNGWGMTALGDYYNSLLESDVKDDTLALYWYVRALETGHDTQDRLKYYRVELNY